MSDQTALTSSIIEVPLNDSFGVDDGVLKSQNYIRRGEFDLESTSSQSLDREDFTSEETRIVNFVKYWVYGTLLAAAIVVGLSAYFLLDREQGTTFEAEFVVVADHTSDSIEMKVQAIVSQLMATSAATTSQALEDKTDNSWPKVTLPHFGARTSGDLNSDVIMYAPIVPEAELEDWEAYSNQNQEWIIEELEYQGGGSAGSISPNIYSVASPPPTSMDAYAPLWQSSPLSQNLSLINLDLLSHPTIGQLLGQVSASEDPQAILSCTSDDHLSPLDLSRTNTDVDSPSTAVQRGMLAVPVLADFHDGASLVGYVLSIFQWENLLENILSDDTGPVIVDLEETCGPGFSFKINGSQVTYLGEDYESQDPLEDHRMRYQVNAPAIFATEVVPTEEMQAKHTDITPAVPAAVAVSIFVITTFVFFFFTLVVRRRQNKLLVTAQLTNAVVSSLFPEDVQKRLMAEEKEKVDQRHHHKTKYDAHGRSTMSHTMKEFLEDESDQRKSKSPAQMMMTKPIADFFPEATIMFGDLVGFTAWSSERQPTQVFTLLECIYNAFDEIARRRGVFKVETVGDCYVAVAGLPVPCKDHALVIACFANECRHRMNDLVKVLEVTLGPDTTDLAMRFGLHSGPVTAGVLRGDRARFQLFGDTVNTTSRIETTGTRDRIHVSQEFADCLIHAGKGQWLSQREGKVTAKGKGELTTYWLEVAGGKRRESLKSSIPMDEQSNQAANSILPMTRNDLSEKQKRLVNWMAYELAKLLTEVEISRSRDFSRKAIGSELGKLERALMKEKGVTTPLDEVQEIITLPALRPSSPAYQVQVLKEQFELSDVVVSELQSYVYNLAVMYQDNPFHNFEHASHVTMSVFKLLSRIVAPDISSVERDVASALHQQTYGIASDPLTQFAVVLSALIHDVDHTGVPNSQLNQENTQLALAYKSKSVAEQKSVDVAWDLLMEDDFENLRGAIYHNEEEFKRFRQLLVNSVMATDILDQDLGALRKARWNKAFSENVEENLSTAANRKATVVIEHLIQASDVAHTMQHWYVYRKWNGRLFEEMYKAYAEGRAEKNPAEGWYEAEMGFFDFYIIPLAIKLKDCGVFGDSSDEYLNYARQNRREWELNGKDVVASMIESIRYKHQAIKPVQPLLRKENIISASAGASTTRVQQCSPELVSKTAPRHKVTALVGSGNLRDLKASIAVAPSNFASLEELPEELRVLVVDDDKILRKLFARSVKKIAPKWVFRDAASGEDALELIASTEEKFDLVFMDQYMGTDSSKLLGSDAVAELRRLGFDSKICGMSANDTEQLFDDAGADTFIFKPLPFRSESLSRELLRVLSTSDDWGCVKVPSGDVGQVPSQRTLFSTAA